MIFTFGLLPLTNRTPLVLLVIPALWSLVGGSAAFLLHVPEDWLLLAIGLLVAVALMIKRRQARPSDPEVSAAHRALPYPTLGDRIYR